jgi:iron complex outermembrane receptor protein
MFQRTKLCTSLLAAFGSGVLAMAPAFAQTATPDASVQRVEITGSAIRRIDAESALPVVVLKKEDIARTGATSTVDLLQRLSTVQGGTQEANSVGGSTFGFSGVSIHNIGETRTLVLLNGHRLSLFGGQTLTGFAAGFDLNVLPISAIERVEVLTDGASALYGADAIAGVVNFITKRDVTEGDITAGFSNPKDGAKETRLSFSKGFGSLETDGWNAIFSFAHDNRSHLEAKDRKFASTGNLIFSKDGNTYRSQAYSYSAIPGNALDDNGNVISPYLIANGSCPTNTFEVKDGSDHFCGFDYVSTLQIYPERTRDSAVASLNKRLGEHDLFLDVLMSSTTQTSRIAPVPGSLSMPADSPYFQQYLAPLGVTQDTLVFYRVADLGARADHDKADFIDLAMGSKGMVAGWDYSATYTHSESNVRANISGYPGALALKKLRASGLLNPFVLTGQQTPAAQAALNATAYNGYWDGGVATLDTVAAQASNEIAKLPAGAMMLAVGANYNKENFTNKPGLFAQGKLADPVAGTLCDANNPALPCDQRFGDAAAEVAYSAGRKSYGAFGELNIPIVKGLEATTDIRFDHFSDFGAATTGKASFRWTPSKMLLFRGSVGTGYHAPSVPQVAASPQSYGVTAGQYTCTPELQQIADSLGAQCRPGNAQYDQVAGGNKDLKPERSKQATFGFRLEPAPAFSFGVDWWWVNIRDSFGQLGEATVFGSPLQYSGSWTTQTDIGTGVKYIAFNAGNLNLGKQYTEGLDFDISGRANLGFAQWTSDVKATRMLRDRFQQEINGGYFTSLGDNSNGGMEYRWKGTWRNTLTHGNFSHTIGVNFRSGYWDAATQVEQLDATGTVIGTPTVQIHVKPFVTLDWQTSWNIGKSFNLTGGLLNLTNHMPPFVLNGTGGQQAGYDANLYDPRGRTLYLNGTVKF